MKIKLSKEEARILYNVLIKTSFSFSGNETNKAKEFFELIQGLQDKLMKVIDDGKLDNS